MEKVIFFRNSDITAYKKCLREISLHNHFKFSLFELVKLLGKLFKATFFSCTWITYQLRQIFLLTFVGNTMLTIRFVCKQQKISRLAVAISLKLYKFGQQQIDKCCWSCNCTWIFINKNFIDGNEKELFLFFY